MDVDFMWINLACDARTALGIAAPSTMLVPLDEYAASSSTTIEIIQLVRPPHGEKAAARSGVMSKDEQPQALGQSFKNDL